MNKIKQVLRYWREDVFDAINSRRAFRLFAVFFGAYLLVSMVLGIYWSFTPKTFNVVEATLKHQTAQQAALATGAVTTSTTLEVVDTLLSKKGGYISNDIFPPGVWLDNIPNWEYGVVLQLRDMTKAMRESFARSQSQSSEDPNLAKADPRFNFSTTSWMFPRTEAIYRQGYDELSLYLDELTNPSAPNAQFYARADNLNYWLEMVSRRLGSMSQRLSASVGEARKNTDLAGETGAKQSTPTAPEVLVRTPWYKVDDVFFEARGTTWALLHFLKAVEVDFATVLEKKNANASLQQIIRELEQSQLPLRSPVILNGGGFGMLANHSLVMASYISRANAGVIELRTLLAQG